MKSILRYFLSLLSSPRLLYISKLSHNQQHNRLNMLISEYNSKKQCGNIGISSTHLQYIIFCSKYKGKGMISLDKIKFNYEKEMFSAQSVESGKLFFSVRCTQTQFLNLQKNTLMKWNF